MKTLKLPILFSILILFTSCPKPEDLIKDSVSIEFYNHIDGTPLIFDSLSGYSDWFSTNSGQNYNILNLFYLITDIKLSDNNGNTLYTLSDIHFVSSDNENSNFIYFPEILSTGKYENIEFVFGLKSENNISNSFIDKDFHTQMFWPDFMGGGYHYMKLEGKFDNETSFYA